MLKDARLWAHWRTYLTIEVSWRAGVLLSKIEIALCNASSAIIKTLEAHPCDAWQKTSLFFDTLLWLNSHHTRFFQSYLNVQPLISKVTRILIPASQVYYNKAQSKRFIEWANKGK